MNISISAPIEGNTKLIHKQTLGAFCVSVHISIALLTFYAVEHTVNVLHTVLTLTLARCMTYGLFILALSLSFASFNVLTNPRGENTACLQ